MIQNNGKLVLNPRVIIRRQEYKFYLYNRDTENVLELNDIGIEIAEKLQKEIYFDELALYFSDKYNISVDKVIADIKDFVKICINKQFFLHVQNEYS